MMDMIYYNKTEGSAPTTQGSFAFWTGRFLDNCWSKGCDLRPNCMCGAPLVSA